MPDLVLAHGGQDGAAPAVRRWQAGQVAIQMMADFRLRGRDEAQAQAVAHEAGGSA